MADRLNQYPPDESPEPWLGYAKTRTELVYANAGSSTRQASILFMQFPEEHQALVIGFALSSQITPTIRDNGQAHTTRFRAIQTTTEDTSLPLKLSCLDRWDRSDQHDEAATAYEKKGIPAHTGIKWKFNYHRNYGVEHQIIGRNNVENHGPIGVPYNFCEDYDAEVPEGVDPRSCIPYIGFYGYDQGQASMGGNWAGFQYFEETGEVYFTPLSWTHVEPLVTGPYGENGKETVWDEHHPQFVARVWVIRKGGCVSVEDGLGQYSWILVEEAGDEDPEWKHQLMNTWKAVWLTLHEGFTHKYTYTFRQR
ncbi:hypothetical protein IL306_008067 [Fusarium sp. DS 682]|nr:hypothetical protein IL306_008067 [Fusarium sp. DS 682]